MNGININDQPCLAFNCGLYIKPELLMCTKHWEMVPRDIQIAVYYSRNTPEYINTAKKARDAVAEHEKLAAIGQAPVREKSSFAKGKKGVAGDVSFFDHEQNFYNRKGAPFLVRCPACNMFNPAPTVATGRCHYCKWKAPSLQEISA